MLPDNSNSDVDVIKQNYFLRYEEVGGKEALVAKEKASITGWEWLCLHIFRFFGFGCCKIKGAEDRRVLLNPPAWMDHTVGKIKAVAAALRQPGSPLASATPAAVQEQVEGSEIFPVGGAAGEEAPVAAAATASTLSPLAPAAPAPAQEQVEGSGIFPDGWDAMRVASAVSIEALAAARQAAARTASVAAAGDANYLNPNMELGDLKNALRDHIPSIGAGQLLPENSASAKAWLQRAVAAVFPDGSNDVSFVSPPAGVAFTELALPPALSKDLFYCSITRGVESDIPRSSLDEGAIHVWGAASQQNGTEAPGVFTPPPGGVMEASAFDGTQGPLAQRTNPRMFELVNAAANLGFNELADVLNEDASGALKHGYLTPNTPDEARATIESFGQDGAKLSALCVKSVPDGGRSPVYLIMGAAAAFGRYFENRGLFYTQEAQDVCHQLRQADLFYHYLAQFNKVLELAQETPDKRVIYHPTALGGGVFENSPKEIAQAFGQAAVWFQNEVERLDLRNVKVQFEQYVFPWVDETSVVDETGSFFPGEGEVPTLLGLKIKPRAGEGAAV